MANRENLGERTQRFGVAAVRFAVQLKLPPALQPLAGQFVRAGTGVGANYRAARRARSYREFTARLAVAVEEVDEAVYWLEVLGQARPEPPEGFRELCLDGAELRAVLAAAWSTASSRLRASRTRGSRGESATT